LMLVLDEKLGRLTQFAAFMPAAVAENAAADILMEPPICGITRLGWLAKSGLVEVVEWVGVKVESSGVTGGHGRCRDCGFNWRL